MPYVQTYTLSASHIFDCLDPPLTLVQARRLAQYFEDGTCRPLLDASTVVPTSTSSTSGVNKDASGSCLGSEGSAPHAVRVANGVLLIARFCCSSKHV